MPWILSRHRSEPYKPSLSGFLFPILRVGEVFDTDYTPEGQVLLHWYVGLLFLNILLIIALFVLFVVGQDCVVALFERLSPAYEAARGVYQF
jgi:hypothetical protein